MTQAEITGVDTTEDEESTDVSRREDEVKEKDRNEMSSAPWLAQRNLHKSKWHKDLAWLKEDVQVNQN